MVKSTLSTGDTVSVTGASPPPSWFDVWILGYLICCSFKSARQDKAASRFPTRTLSAQRGDSQTSLSSLIKAELSSLPCVRLTRPRTHFILVWRLLVDLAENYKGFIWYAVEVKSVLFFPPQWQWCCFWLGSLLPWIIHLMRTKLQVRATFVLYMEKITCQREIVLILGLDEISHSSTLEVEFAGIKSRSEKIHLGFFAATSLVGLFIYDQSAESVHWFYQAHLLTFFY